MPLKYCDMHNNGQSDRYSCLAASSREEAQMACDLLILRWYNIPTKFIILNVMHFQVYKITCHNCTNNLTKLFTCFGFNTIKL